MEKLPGYTKRELQEMADRESERDYRRLRSLGIHPEGDPINRLMELKRLHEELEERRRLKAE